MRLRRITVIAATLAAGALGLPAAALAGGTWTGTELTHQRLSWTTDNGAAAYFTVFVLTQPVESATTNFGAACQVAVPDANPNEMECPAAARTITGAPGTAAAGAVDVVTKAAVGCGDGFTQMVSFDGSTYAAQSAIASANSCGGGGGGGGGGTPPDSGAGGPVATPLLPLVAGADSGGGPHVRSFNPFNAAPVADFFAFDPAFAGGVRVAVGDVNGDGYADVVTGAGPGGGPAVKVFDGHDGHLLSSFFAFDAAFTGGVYVAAGDVNGDGFADIVTGAGPGGGAHVSVFDGHTGALLRSFFAFAAPSSGGVRVAAGDVNGDGFADIVTGAGPGGGPAVKVFDGHDNHVLSSFFAYSAAFTGGVFVAAGDVDGDGAADVVTGPGAGGSPTVKAFAGDDGHALASFSAYSAGFTGGVRVAIGDVNGDGEGDIIAAPGPGGAPTLKAFDATNAHLLQSFNAFAAGFTGGVFVASALTPGASVKSGRVRFNAHGAASVRVTCRRGGGACKGTVGVYVKRVLLGRAAFSLAAGANKAIEVHLSKARLRHVPAKATGVLVVKTRDAGGNARTTTLSVTLRRG